MNAGFRGFRIDLFSKHNGKIDFLFRLTQVKIAAVGDGHAQLIEHTVSQFRHSLTSFVCDFPQLRSDLLKLAVRAISAQYIPTTEERSRKRMYRSMGEPSAQVRLSSVYL